MPKNELFDVLVVGAGPTGLACAIEAQHRGLKTVAIDKGCIVNSLFHYPAGMVFFTTPELLEIGDLPFSSAHQKPTREEALEYYRKPHPYSGCDVLVIGGKNSAAISALDLYRHGARVTLVHRGSGMRPRAKYWIKPDIENRIKNGEIKAYFNSCVKEIRRDEVLIETPEGAVELKNDFDLVLTGYHPDFAFRRKLGIRLSEDKCRPLCDPQTFESNVPGIYLAGVIVAGSATSEIFIENGRFHGRQIAQDLERKLVASRQ